MSGPQYTVGVRCLQYWLTTPLRKKASRDSAHIAVLWEYCKISVTGDLTCGSMFAHRGMAGATRASTLSCVGI